MKDERDNFFDAFENAFGVRPKPVFPRVYKVQGSHYRMHHLLELFEMKTGKKYAPADPVHNSN